MLDEKIPVIFAHSSSRLYQNCLKKHFNDIIPMYMPDASKPLTFKKIVTFFEYVGNNIETIEILKNILNILSFDSSFLIIDDTYEGLLDKKALEKLKNLIESYSNITEWKIYSSNKNLSSLMLDVFGSADNFTYFNIHLHLPEYDHVIPRQINFNINNKLRKKKFLCVNRQERYHRLKTIDFLAKNKLLKEGFVSSPMGEYAHILSQTTQRLKLNPELENYQDPKLLDVNLTYDEKYRLSSILPLELDVPENQYRFQSTRMPLLNDYFENSYFSIVTEGDFWSDAGKQQFTEKVIKCFLFYHPFILIGLPKTLQLIRDMGFLTFSNIIDERYDDEFNDEKRLSMALQQASRLCSMNINQLKNTYEKVIPILEHNRKLAVQYNLTPVPSKLANEILQWYWYD